MVIFITTPYVCLVVLGLSFVLVLKSISYLPTQLIVFFLVMVKVKRVIVVIILSLRNYMYLVFFLEHIFFVSILNMSQQVSKSDFICIDPFLNDPPNLPPYTSSSSIDVSHSPMQPNPYHFSCRTRIATNGATDDISRAPPSIMFYHILLWPSLLL